MNDKNLMKEGTAKVVEVILLAFRITKPTLTKREVENLIINTGNYLQLERLNEANLTSKPLVTSSTIEQ